MKIFNNIFKATEWHLTTQKINSKQMLQNLTQPLRRVAEFLVVL